MLVSGNVGIREAWLDAEDLVGCVVGWQVHVFTLYPYFPVRSKYRETWGEGLAWKEGLMGRAEGKHVIIRTETRPRVKRISAKDLSRFVILFSNELSW